MMTKIILTNSLIHEWLIKMSDAGWVFCPWLYDDGTIFSHADEHAVTLNAKECGKWCVFYASTKLIVDPYTAKREQQTA